LFTPWRRISGVFFSQKTAFQPLLTPAPSENQRKLLNIKRLWDGLSFYRHGMVIAHALYGAQPCSSGTGGINEEAK
jgi:hypothetical protein